MNAPLRRYPPDIYWSLHWLDYFFPGLSSLLLLLCISRTTQIILKVKVLRCPSGELLIEEIDRFAEVNGYPRVITTDPYFTNSTDYRASFDAWLEQHQIIHTIVSLTPPDSRFVGPKIARELRQIVGCLHDSKQRPSNHCGKVASQFDVQSRFTRPMKMDPVTRRMWVKMPSGEYANCIAPRPPGPTARRAAPHCSRDGLPQNWKPSRAACGRPATGRPPLSRKPSGQRHLHQRRASE